MTMPHTQSVLTELKAELIRRLSLYKEKCVRQLLIREEMGDRRQPQFLRHIRTFASPSVASVFLRNLCTNRLPSNMRT